MFLKRRQRRVPELNTTSTADISFMLLILFLVATSMDIDKGLSRQLPPPTPPEETIKEREVERENILNVSITADNKIAIEGQTLGMEQLKKRVTDFISKRKNKHILRIEAAPEAKYDTYFKMQNAIIDCYRALRDDYARKTFGKSYAQCNEDERQVVSDYYPQRISETPNKKEGGRQ